MKRIHTNSRHKVLFGRRIFLAVTAVVLAVSVPMAYVQQAMADRWDSQISSLQAQADQYQAQANELAKKGDTLQNKLDQINAQVSALQTQIDVNQRKNEQLEKDIAANQVKLSKAQEGLGEILANLYVDDDVSSFELLASSQNIGDFVDKQEYRSAVRDQLNTTISDVKKLKKQLEDDKKAVEKILTELGQQQQQLGAVQSEQQQLVNETRGEEAAYQQLLSNARNSMASARAQQQAYYASLGGNTGGGTVGSFTYWGWSGNRGCGSDGYPYCGGQDTYSDPWNLYNRECVSYVAWAVQNRFGGNVQPFHGDGNAYQWPSSAPYWSGAYRVYDPQPGDVVVLPATSGFAPVGHVMIVESVQGDGSMFVSQYNFYGTGQYSTMFVKNSGIILLRFPR